MRSDNCFPVSAQQPKVVIPPLPPGSCSSFTDENLAGTAATEQCWVLLEHPGHWGRDIFDGHAFDEETSAALKKKMKDAAARLLLIRRPGREGQLARTSGALRAFVADSVGNKLYAFTVQSASDLVKLPLERPSLIPGVKLSQQVLMLVCTHAKRDRCCALRGRPIAGYLAGKLEKDTVWECSHTGGHRFAPVGLTMPSGYTYGRLTAESALTAVNFLADRSVPSTAGLRGKSSLTPPEQAAEVEVRRLLEDAGEVAGIEELTVDELPQRDGAKVTHIDGRTWTVKLHRKPLPPRPNSCGKDAKAASSFNVVSIEQE